MTFLLSSLSFLHIVSHINVGGHTQWQTINGNMTEPSTSFVVYEAEKGVKVKAEEAEEALAPARDKRPSVSFSRAADQVLQVSSTELEGSEAAMMEVEGRMVSCGLMSHHHCTCHCSRWDDERR